MIFLVLAFSLNTIAVGVYIFSVNDGKNNWKKTEKNLHGFMKYFMYIFGYLCILSIIFSLIIYLTIGF